VDLNEAVAAPSDWIAVEATVDPSKTTGGVTRLDDNDKPGGVEEGVRSTRRSLSHRRRRQRRRSPIDEDNGNELPISDESKMRGREEQIDDKKIDPH
jgi:hypothetical protein